MNTDLTRAKTNGKGALMDSVLTRISEQRLSCPLDGSFQGICKEKWKYCFTIIVTFFKPFCCGFDYF